MVTDVWSPQEQVVSWLYIYGPSRDGLTMDMQLSSGFIHFRDRTLIVDEVAEWLRR